MAAGVHRSRGPGVDVDCAAIRRARLAAGMSLADVAGTDVSRAAVHRIETGKVRPSMTTLRLIAERTGTEVGDFLVAGRAESESGAEQLRRALELLRLERLVIEGRHREVVARSRELLADAVGRPVESRLRYLVGVAHVELQEAMAGLVHLRQARAAFEAADDAWMVVECMGWESAALAHAGDGSAVEVAMEALRRCRALVPVPSLTECRILGHLAAIHLSVRDWERAIAAYLGAIEAAGPVNDQGGLARMYEELSLAYEGQGNVVAATTCMREAVTLSSVSADRARLARIESNLGVLLLRSQRWDEAERHLQLALEQSRAAGVERAGGHVLLNMAQLAHHQGDHARSEALCRRAIDLAGRAGDTLTGALGQQWLGRVLGAAGRHPEADLAYETALSQFADLASPFRLAECHREFAVALQARDELHRAVVHWQRAAELWQQPPVDPGTVLGWADAGSIAPV